MKKIIAMLLVLIAGLTAFGTVIVTYAYSDTRNFFQLSTPSPVAQPAQLLLQPTPTPTQPPTLYPLLSQGNGNRPEIALTFDDGPNPTYTPQILSILQKYGISATFFTIGEQVQAYPYLVQQEYAAGHIVGNHSWNHPDLTTLSADAIRSQLSSTSYAIQQATGVSPAFFRPPYGAYNYQVLLQGTELELRPTLWSIDTRDWDGPPASNVIVQRVLSQAHNGSIILMHDGGGDRSQTVAALPTIITGLQQRGYQFVTLQQLVNDLSQ